MLGIEAVGTPRSAQSRDVPWRRALLVVEVTLPREPFVYVLLPSPVAARSQPLQTRPRPCRNKYRQRASPLRTYIFLPWVPSGHATAMRGWRRQASSVTPFICTMCPADLSVILLCLCLFIRSPVVTVAVVRHNSGGKKVQGTLCTCLPSRSGSSHSQQ